MELLTIDPVDVLYLRGNRLFAEAGHAQAEFPPWPSMFSGALRSSLLMRDGALESFLDGELGGQLGEAIGAGRRGDALDLGAMRIALVGARVRGSMCFPMPADLLVFGDRGTEGLARLRPKRLDALGLRSSFALAEHPVLERDESEKAREGYWLTAAGFAKYQSGGVPDAGELIHQSAIMATDLRLGIALSHDTGSAADGMLYTTETAALARDAGFVIGVEGAGDLLKSRGLLRIGGDGRGASVAPLTGAIGPEPWSYLPKKSRFAMVLHTPGVFPGWHPPLREGKDIVVGGLRATLVSAVVPRSVVISGWDLARSRPKPAVAAVAAGAVYFFQRQSGELGELARLRDEGLWGLFQDHPIDDARRAEGFNNVWFADLPDRGE